MLRLLKINIKILFFLTLLYFSICFALLSYEGGDEGYFLRIIHALINHRIFLVDFATKDQSKNLSKICKKVKQKMFRFLIMLFITFY